MRRTEVVEKRAALAWSWIMFLLFAWLLYRTAWVSDDAFISLRTVSNLLDGYGLRWNVSERVQTFTHPLWLGFLTAAHGVTSEPFYSTLYLSWAVSTATVACLLFACPGQLYDKTLALVALAFSQAFIDFSSSGLENPLTHLLLVVFCVAYARLTQPKARALVLSSIAGLAALNRLDSVLLFAPALGRVVWQNRKTVPWWFYVAGVLPIGAWEVFSVIYYGFPFPNTAYAKLGQQSGSSELLLKGGKYLLSSLNHDPITLSTLGAVVVLCVARRQRETLWLWLGAGAYVLYAVRVGGDFMTGRFLSAPLVLSAACSLRLAVSSSTRARVLSSIFVVGLAALGQYPPPLTGADFSLAAGESDVDEYGIHNERRLFFANSSLRNADKINPLHADHPWSSGGHQLHSDAERENKASVRVIDAIGYVGYFAGPRVHIVDHWALADALIARLPAAFGQYGHYPRVIPAGYYETLYTGQPLIHDLALRQYYAALVRAIRDPLWSAERWRAIWQLNTGQLTPLLDRYGYAHGPEISVKLSVANPTQYPYVQTYVWNDYRTTAYQLDSASRPGSQYELTWRITARAATLLQPTAASKTSELGELRPRGFFTVTVAFSEQPGGPLRELHELRYTYQRQGDQLVVQRHPWPVWSDKFPDGKWHEGRAPGVLQLEETNVR
jgi:arabinofuranosyltransferase